MSFNASFQEILEEKMQQSSAFSRASSRENLSTSPFETDPVHLAFLLGSVDRFSFTSCRAQKSYPRPRPKPRPAHVMTAPQQESFEYLKSFDGTLNDNFNSRELKTAFRVGALRTHPDQGGGAFEFMKLKAHYESLLSLLTPE
jgi:hypothetical protein